MVQQSSSTKKIVVAVNKHRIKIKVTTKLPKLVKNVILYVEIQRHVSLASNKKLQRLKEVNELWYDIIKANTSVNIKQYRNIL